MRYFREIYVFLSLSLFSLSVYSVGNQVNSFSTGGPSGIDYNVGYGTQVFGASYTHSQGTAMGYEALDSSSTGDANSAFGYQSLYQTTTGANNTSLGSEAGYSNVSGSGNVFLGYQAGYSETGSNKLYISNSNTSSPLIYGDFATGALTLGDGGNGTGAISIGSSGTRNITIGSSNANTVIRGLSKNPSHDDEATSRAYVDSIGALAAVLDTRLPASGKNNRLSLNTASIHNQSAVGASLVGIINRGNRLLDYSVGIASSSGQTMSKFSFGLSF